MWKLTVVADAPPAIIFGVAFAGMTCLRSMMTVSFAAIETVVAIATPSMASVYVAPDAAVFVTMMLVTTVVVLVVGTVYKVVAVFVVAAPRKRTFEVVAISYYAFRFVIFLF